MKAIVQKDFGTTGVLELREIDAPEVGDDDVLLRVRAAGVHAGDFFCMTGTPYPVRFAVGWPRPKTYVPGYDVAGVVEAVGSKVTHLEPGDEVFGGCTGGLAELVRAKADHLVRKPSGISFEQAGVIATSALAALHGVRDAGKVQSGQHVLINGASGGVGHFEVQIAKHLGAEVTGVCSARNVDMVRSLGADHVIDYTSEDYTEAGARYDLILDNVGNRPFSECRRALKPTGKHIPNSGHAGLGFVLAAMLRSLLVSQQGRPYLSSPNKEDMDVLRQLIEEEKLAPVIDRTYPLAEAADAISYVGEGHAHGKVVVTV